ncbi:MAG TPA: TatD family hydrolase [Candidatus Acidoferrales bacterium]|nr:TatD family hydrolase [Candidatus Acidoferrales bacterium]
MRYIEPHAHMVSRVTDDYERMAVAGCEAVCEPAFWAGFDRGSAAGFYDYFRQLTEHEPKRAARFGLKHFCWLCINPKESEDVKLAAEVIALIPEFLNRPNVLGIGEIGLNKNSRNELKVLEMQVDLAARYKQLILVHTPHLEDKLKGTRLILDVLKSDKRIRPERVIIDHVEEHTVGLVLGAGFWAGMTLYPETKCSPARAIDILETYGQKRIWLNSACDWGVSDPLAVPKTAVEMKKRGHHAMAIDKVIYQNPRTFLAQCPKFEIRGSVKD